ncbi:hypothetical protein U1Q18_039382, partial [Sarracenia purpurea var. burkii]
MEDRSTSKSPSKPKTILSKHVKEIGPSNPRAKKKRKAGRVVTTSKNPKKAEVPSASSK